MADFRQAPLGEILVARGRITEAQLEEALDRKRELGSRLGQALVALGYVTEFDIAEALNEQGRVASIRLESALVDAEVAEALGSQRSWAHRAVAFHEIGGVTSVALEDPLDVSAVDEISRALGKPVFPVHASSPQIEAVLQELFPRVENQRSQLETLLEEILQLPEPAEDAPRGSSGVEESEAEVVVGLVDGILTDAYAWRASDVHLEPRKDRFVVRFRVDGTLIERVSLPRFWMRPVLSRLKILSGLDIAQKRLPQDGRIQTSIDGRDVDLRVSTTPTLHGEGAAVRILDCGQQLFGLEQLGFEDAQLGAIREIIAARDGFVIATGPTGSGKTTTLYSILRELASPETKIVTLEDPVEKELEEAFQIATNAKIGMNFAAGLRSVLRLDPDVIMVGEVRDLETARIALQAALTGHLVFTTLATVGTAKTISRLQDMQLERFLLADTLRGIISQRLVKRICPHCKERFQPSELELRRARLGPDDGPFFAGRGCTRCKGTGFKGRTGVYEVLCMDDELNELVARGALAREIHQRATQKGMTSLRAHGLRKVRSGEASLAEIVAVTAGSTEA
ncbi:MAG: Flp pilus assembly complex ATPase component TadA [Planctomycetes bacterium]|nr:Flp pilus assembly complex ATPase component TadA [Planctomycetota bacterium]